jgi:hypothetical protein
MIPFGLLCFTRTTGSHMQATGGDAVDTLCLELQQKGFACWYDQRAKDLTEGTYLTNEK